MIVIVGSPVARLDTRGLDGAGLAVEIARAASASGGAVQLVGRVGEDPAGDAVLLDLAADDVGHVAVLRDPGRPTPTVQSVGDPAPAGDETELGRALASDDEGPADAPIDGLPLDAADLELALRYLPDYRVIVLATDLDEPARATVAGAAGWAGAHLVVLAQGGSAGADWPDDATILERPPTDVDGAFAAMVAAYAVALDRGAEAGAAFAEASGARGWEPVVD